MSQVEKKGAKGISSENSITNLISVDPGGLMRDNPAGLIVNKESYACMESYFSPEQLDPPQVVRVKTYSPEHGEIIRIFVVDGLTRTKFINDHKEKTLSDYPQFSFTKILVRDVTSAVLKNSKMVSLNERAENEQSLTMIQYLRAVVPPTKEHSEIAPDRIAAHLINGWVNMVGPELSDNFSALAALNLLKNPKVPTATREILNKFLTSQSEIMSGETREERRILQKSLIDMASIIYEAKLSKDQVAQAAFLLIGLESPVIGGTKAAEIQTYGLLYTPTVEKKLVEAFPQFGEREKMRLQLGRLILNTFKKLVGAPDRQTSIDLPGEVLKDTSLNFQQVFDILNSSSPSQEYIETKQEINRTSLAEYYLSAQEKGALSTYEMTLIDQLGRKTYLDDNPQTLTLRIKEADNAITRANDLIGRLNSGREELLRGGVKPDAIDGGCVKLTLGKDAVLKSNSLYSISKDIHKLEEAVSSVQQEIDRQVLLYRIGEIIDDEARDTSQTKYGSEIKRYISFYILRNIHNPLDNKRIKVFLKELSSLDESLQLEVLQGTTRIAQALKSQNDRGRSVLIPEKKIFPLEQISSEKIMDDGALPTVPIESSKTETEKLLVDKELTERRRRMANNERLKQITRSYYVELVGLDLEVDELADETREELYKVLKELGRFAFRHPDIVRVVKDIFEENKRKIKIKEIKVEQEIEDAQKDTRTKQ